MPKRLSIKQKELLKKHEYILERLATASSKERKIILENSPSEIFQVLTLIFRILSDQTIKLPQKHEKNIKKHRKFIQTTNDLNRKAIKRKLKSQRGGFLPAILSAALPIISGIIGKLL